MVAYNNDIDKQYSRLRKNARIGKIFSRPIIKNKYLAVTQLTLNSNGFTNTDDIVAA